jgi:hypothetical protein
MNETFFIENVEFIRKLNNKNEFIETLFTAESAFLYRHRHRPVPRRSKSSNVLKRP